jgi:hypothetical protein
MTLVRAVVGTRDRQILPLAAESADAAAARAGRAQTNAMHFALAGRDVLDRHLTQGSAKTLARIAAWAVPSRAVAAADRHAGC